MKKFPKINSAALLIAAALVLGMSASALADTIRLKDGSVIRGQVVGFRDQQFTVLVGTGSRGRRSRITLYMEDVESVEFDSAGATETANAGGNDSGMNTTATQPAQTNPAESRPAPATVASNPPVSAPSAGSPAFFPINVRVRADNAANGWTNTGLVVRRGQRLRISASGRVLLGGGRYSTPTGLPNDPGTDKLMRNEPTGGLVAVIGDDNDDFIFIGSRREFTAQRDGVLFLGVNEGNLANNSGAYDAVVEAEAVAVSGVTP